MYSVSPLRPKRLNRRNGSIQKISVQNYISRKKIPVNAPLNLSPQKVFSHNISPINLDTFEENGDLFDPRNSQPPKGPVRPLDIEDVLRGVKANGREEMGFGERRGLDRDFYNDNVQRTQSDYLFDEDR